MYVIIAIAAWFYPDPDVATSNEFDGFQRAISAAAGVTSTAIMGFKAQGTMAL